MEINRALKSAISRLKEESQNTSAHLDAEVLLSAVLKKPKEFLYIHGEYSLNKKQTETFNQFIKKRSNGEPVAYLTGHKEFYGLDFLVNKNTLIPRPDTEVLVETVVEKISAQGESALGGKKTRNHPGTTARGTGYGASKIKIIADIGTGSGCIAITLKKLLPKINIIATDISGKALLVAKKNAKINKVKIKFIKSNLLKKSKNQKIDIIVANLPYVKYQKNPGTIRQGRSYGASKTNNLKFEPNLALDGGKDGLEIYKKLFQQIKSLEYQPKFIFCEIDPRQKIKINKIIKSYFLTSKINFIKDLCGKTRVTIIEN